MSTSVDAESEADLPPAATRTFAAPEVVTQETQGLSAKELSLRYIFLKAIFHVVCPV